MSGESPDLCLLEVRKKRLRLFVQHLIFSFLSFSFLSYSRHHRRQLLRVFASRTEVRRFDSSV